MRLEQRSWCCTYCGLSRGLLCALTPDDLDIHRHFEAVQSLYIYSKSSTSVRRSLLSLTSNSESITFLSFSSPSPWVTAKISKLPVLIFSLIPINPLSSLLSLFLNLWIYSKETFRPLSLTIRLLIFFKCSFRNFLMGERKGWIPVPARGWSYLPGRYFVRC